MKNINFKIGKERNQMSKNRQLKLISGGSSHVRMSSSEYEQIKKDSEASGQSIPDLLREAYFSQPPRRVLVNKNDLDILRKDLNRIGNNLNQITRKLNAGLMTGWSNKLDLILEQFDTLTNQIYYGYGVLKG